VIRRSAGRLLRVGTAAALLAYTLWRSNPQQVASALSGAAPGPLLVAELLVIVDRGLMAWRWLILLEPLGSDRLPQFSAILRIFFVSTFVGTFLPASVGGDAVRAVSLSRLDVPAPDAIASVFLDRMLGVLSILLMALVGLLLASDLATAPGLAVGLMVTALACAATMALIFSARIDGAIEGILRRLPWRAAHEISIRLVASVRRYAGYRRELTLVLLASVLVQILRIVQAYALGRALGIGVPFTVYVAFIPIILLIMLLPITVNGIGTSQAAFLWLFARAGTPEAESFALSVLFVALGLVGNLPGAFLYATGSRGKTENAKPKTGRATQV
jgi:uncharacterized protein (TIRG00374 family)